MIKVSTHPLESVQQRKANKKYPAALFKQRRARTIFYIVSLAAVVIYLIPLWWTISTSLRTNVNIFAPDQWIPHPITFEHYTKLFEYLPDFGTFLSNTLLIAVLSTFGLLLSSSMAGYALARMRFPGRSVLLFILLLTLMVPGQATLIPVYVLFRNFDWINTPLPIIIPAFFGNAFAAFFFRQFFLTIPGELEEAALIDGAGRWRIFLSVIIPVSKPAYMALGLLTFVGQWNSFFVNSVYLQTRDQWVLTQALQSLIGQYNSQFGEIMAGVVLISLPIIVLYIFLQRSIAEGITFSGITG
jgi:multiple sugar transport system permease protein